MPDNWDEAGDPPVEDGDIVRLKSGGPPMTCIGVAANGTAVVTWFDEDDQMHECVFHVRYLEHCAPGG